MLHYTKLIWSKLLAFTLQSVCYCFVCLSVSLLSLCVARHGLWSSSHDPHLTTCGSSTNQPLLYVRPVQSCVLCQIIPTYSQPCQPFFFFSIPGWFSSGHTPGYLFEDLEVCILSPAAHCGCFLIFLLFSGIFQIDTKHVKKLACFLKAFLVNNHCWHAVTLLLHHNHNKYMCTSAHINHSGTAL